jgi:hypothetical protein
MGNTSCVWIPGHAGTDGQDSSEGAAEAAVKAGVVESYEDRQSDIKNK